MCQLAVSLLVWRLVLLENTFLDQLVGSRTTLELLVQAICSHVFLQALLVGLNARGGVTLGQDVACRMSAESRSMLDKTYAQ
jgi:hypothetical protein